MASSSASTWVRRVVLIAVVIGVAVAGIVVGMRLRDRVSPPFSEDAVPTTPPKLGTGSPFPDVALTAEDGSVRTTRELLEGKGGVVMFVEVGCPPCSVMAKRWQKLLDDGDIPAARVLGITSASLESIRSYKESKRLSFSIYSDSRATFERDYEVTSYPLRLVVGRSLTIRSHSFDANEKVDPAAITALMVE